MTQSPYQIATAFIADSPPGQIDNVATSLNTLTAETPLADLTSAFKAYNLSHTVAVDVPISKAKTLVSRYSELPDGRFHDPDSAQSFAFNHKARTVSDWRPYETPSSTSASGEAKEIKELVKALTPLYAAHVTSHFPPSATTLVTPFPVDSGKTLILQTLSSRLSPGNFLAGEWLSTYTLTLTPSSLTITPAIRLTVHYYEDGNVRLETGSHTPRTGAEPSKSTEGPSITVQRAAGSEGTAKAVIREIAAFEKRYQEGVEGGLAGLAEGAFKSLRRNLPVTLMKMDWEKVETYRAARRIGIR